MAELRIAPPAIQRKPSTTLMICFDAHGDVDALDNRFSRWNGGKWMLIAAAPCAPNEPARVAWNWLATTLNGAAH